ncbi:YnbE family lipoprotein [Sphingopyxis microcysteis]|uniref:YnbE family lipoprotein n=1 Tax=Sphingopyxis microcysteis TaxID=2484145 RepID=UPI001444C35C|nr:YnbE family lipoprotein [Sphingopyxis microcysteis]
MNITKTGARRLAKTARKLAVLIGAAALTGCVQIETPDKPIEINLNINIRQEVVYRLDGDAKKLIEQNSEIF